jgi:hypothetical protein
MTRTRAAALIGASLLALAAPATVSASAKYELLKQLQVEQTWASIRGQYGKVWPLLHPRYQRVTTRAFWEACQRKHAQKTAGVEWLSVKATAAYPDRVTLPLLGSIPVVAVSFEVKSKYLGRTKTVRDTHYWTTLKPNSGFVGLWDPETYRAYNAHRCGRDLMALR